MNEQKALFLLILVMVVLFGGIMACATGDDVETVRKDIAERRKEALK